MALHGADAQGGADAKGCAAVMHHPRASICISHVFPCGFQNVNLPGSKIRNFSCSKDGGEMHCKRWAILKMVLSHGFNWNPLPEWQVSLACNLFFWQRGVFLISREQMKEKCPACSEQSINTFYHPIAGSLQARVTPFKMLYLPLTKIDACDS